MSKKSISAIYYELLDLAESLDKHNTHFRDKSEYQEATERNEVLFKISGLISSAAIGLRDEFRIQYRKKK